MKTADLLFRPGSEYDFYRLDTGEKSVTLRDSFEPPWWLRFTIPADQPGLTLLSVYQDIHGWLCPVSERRLRQIGAYEFVEVEREEYQGTAIYVPGEVQEGSTWAIDTRGRWTWQNASGARDQGFWLYRVHGSLLLGRLTINEVYSEYDDHGNPPTLFERDEVFDGEGFAGFKDRLVSGWPGVLARKQFLVDKNA